MRVLVLLACLVLAGCGQGSGLLPGVCGLGARTVLPVTMRGNLPLVAVTINDRRAMLVLDTGADRTVLSRTMAPILGIRPQGAAVAMNAVGGVSSTQSGTIDRLVVGDQRFTSWPVSLATFEGLDGVLGLDVLGRYDLEVDLAHEVAVLHGGSVCAGELPPMTGSVLEIPAIRGVLRAEGRQGAGDPYIMVPVSLDGIKAFAMLDTGAAPGSLVSTSFARKAGVTDQALAGDPVFTVNGFGTKADTRRHRFGELLVGREVFAGPTILVGGGLQEQLPVIIGSDYFLSHRVWFNFAGQRVFVVPAALVR